MSDEVLREMCDKNYHQLLPLIAEKMQKEKEQKDKLNAVKARLIYGEESGIKIRSREESHYSESKTPTARTEPRSCTEAEGGVFNRLGRKESTTSARSDSRQRSPQAKRTEVEARRRQQKGTPSRTTSQYSESKDSEGGHWKSKLRRQRSDTYEDDLSQPWTCEERNPFTPSIGFFKQSISKDPVGDNQLQARDGESTEDFMERYKAEVLDVEGAPECMRISGFMHGITHPGLIKRLYERIPRYMDEMYRMPTSFLQGEVVALSHGQRKASSSWKPSEGGNKPNFKKGFKNKHRPDRKPDRFSLLTKTPKEIFALEKGKFKAPPPMRTVTLQSSRVIPMECAMIFGPSIQSTAENQVLEEKINIAIHPEYPEQTVAIGSTLTEKGRKELCSLLKQNLDIFAWKPADMTGVPRNIAEHRLNIREGYSPVRQKKRGQAPEINKVIQEEVKKLVEAGIMKEVHYHSWLSNPVMVKKHDGTWRMCVDFKDLNNACPKDCYPLPEIDWKVESLCGYSFKCFLDAYKGYHQIKMAKEDEEKWVHKQAKGFFAYSKMPFGLKMRVNISTISGTKHSKADWTYLESLCRRPGYKEPHGRRNHPRYNRNIQNPSTDKHEIEPKEVHLRNAGRNVLRLQKAKWKISPSLNRFLSKSAEKSLPFFKTLKNCTKKSDFQWTPEAEEAFKQMKKLIAELPTLTAPREREELIIYLAAAIEVFINYTPMEKLVLALLSASKRLKRYFQAHTIVVITNQPIKQLLSSSEISGRMLKWKFELEGYDIQYRPRTAIKGQILTDFIVERPEEESTDDLMAEPDVLPGAVFLFTEARHCVGRSGRTITNKSGGVAGLRIARAKGVKILPSNVDSRLVANKLTALHRLRVKAWCFVEELKEKSINEKEILDVVEEEGNTWMTPICMNWPTMHMDARNLIRECNDCQIHRPVPRNPQQNLTPITSPWPFYKWGIDIAGPFPEGPVKKVRMDNIVCRFGLPWEIISDNGKQFRDNPFKDWCKKLCIRQCFASVKHRKANCYRVERANRSLGEGIKARLDEKSKDWIEELPHVLWAHRTMIKSSNGETPFSLTYGTEAVIPAEIGMPHFRQRTIRSNLKTTSFWESLGTHRRKEGEAAIQEAKSKKKRWKIITTQSSAEQVSNRVIWIYRKQ
ncbi:reverse transcriptase domain-containing protein [Tanacetum coccineum]